MSITRPLGFRAAAAATGVKRSGRRDLMLLVRDPHPGATPSAAAVFTTNAVVGAPIELGRRWRGRADRPPLRALLVNSGCSNAATGEEGLRDAERTMRATAEALGCAEDEVLPSSTGIIGHRMAMDRIVPRIGALAGALARGPEADAGAAEAILTTDLVPKTAERTVELAGRAVTVAGIAKGSGMIAPRLDSAAWAPPHATMLAFLTTDAALEPGLLQSVLERCAGGSFNRISVDGHPSCSDSAFAIASGLAPPAGRDAARGHDPMPPLRSGSADLEPFERALADVCVELARAIVRDGEGATRTFRVEVRGTPSPDLAERMARAVVDSPLVKCAIHGRDPNWGRIVTAAGNAGVAFAPRETSLSIGGVEVYRAGVPTGADGDGEALRAAMGAGEVDIVLTVGAGTGRAWMIGCDLSGEYVRINADYST